MGPDYSGYSIAELEDALANIDREAFPDRVERIKDELNSRHPLGKNNPKTLDDNFESNEQFFRCPSCEEKIGFFSKTANKWGKRKVCPHCNSPFETMFKLKVFAIAFIPALIINLFVLRPLVVSLGFNGAFSTGILCGIITVLTMRYRKIRSPNTA
ncbi:hypothetical protein GTQ48_16510 [Alteromonas genovensis]|uniref:Uncharacterized protein n=1 Tax=Alteromonas genovensis TaxID=471225 RepID=A0A6N9TNQ0_9ALTE|nr:hypothetical protein [Alteromonas genovensis]NDW17119.1 hypothetical protein [Alteromonas genovensis]